MDLGPKLGANSSCNAASKALTIGQLFTQLVKNELTTTTCP